MTTLSAGHMLTDLAQGSIPALLAFLIAHDHIACGNWRRIPSPAKPYGPAGTRRRRGK
jgi:hypothetical protein